MCIRDSYRTINEAYARAHAGKIELKVQGDEWGRLTAKELLKDVANNPGAGGMAAMGAGIGMGAASAGVFSSLANQLFTPCLLYTSMVEGQANPSAVAKKLLTRMLAEIRSLGVGIVIADQSPEKVTNDVVTVSYTHLRQKKNSIKLLKTVLIIQKHIFGKQYVC